MHAVHHHDRRGPYEHSFLCISSLCCNHRQFLSQVTCLNQTLMMAVAIMQAADLLVVNIFDEVSETEEDVHRRRAMAARDRLHRPPRIHRLTALSAADAADAQADLEYPMRWGKSFIPGIPPRFTLLVLMSLQSYSNICRLSCAWSCFRERTSRSIAPTHGTTK